MYIHTRHCLHNSVYKTGVLNIFIGMKITKHSVFTTVVSGTSYGKIRDASPKKRNLQNRLKYSEF